MASQAEVIVLASQSAPAGFPVWPGGLNCGGISSFPSNPQRNLIFLSISINKGRTYGTPVPQSLGEEGEYLTNPIWWRLGLGRDFVFAVSWYGSWQTALNGAYVEFEKAET